MQVVMTPLFAILALLLDSAQAAVPRDLQARLPACNRDNCFRDVFGTRILGQSAQGALDCTSYLQQTVTPCAVVQVSTVFTTVTTTSTPVVTSITTDTQTNTATSVVTLTTTVVPSLKQAFFASRCPITASATATAIPLYASTCTGTRFSSVCSCNGNVPTPITLAPSTMTVMTTITSTITIVTTAPATTTTTTATTATSVTTTTTSIVTPTKPVDDCIVGQICVGKFLVQTHCGYYDVYKSFEHTALQVSYAACAAACSKDLNCFGFNWNWFTTVCNFYANPDLVSSNADDQYDSGLLIGNC